MDGRSVLGAALLALLVGGLAPLVAPPVTMARTVPCPEERPLTVRDMVRLQLAEPAPGGGGERAHQCFGGSRVWIRGFVNRPDGLGGASVAGVEPLVFEWPQLYLFPSAREAAPGYGAGVPFGITVPPRFGRVWNTFRGSWVDVTARFEDPFADRCRGYGPTDLRPTRAEAIAICRDAIVLTSIRVAAGPPPTSTASTLGLAEVGPATRTPWHVLVPAACLGAWLAWRRSPPRVARRPWDAHGRGCESKRPGR